MVIDFHVHSTASDGTVAPGEIAEQSASRGFAAIALTDHDNVDGIIEFLSQLPTANHQLPTRRISGIELSIEPGEGFDKFHLLGLGIDPEDAGLKAFLRRVLDGRNARNERIFANFHRLGIDIRPEPHGEVLARPHFAKWLIDNGYAKDKNEAFAKYLLPESPDATRCYEERYHPSQEEAFRVVHAAGGICVMAHPKYWQRDWKYVGCDFAKAERGLAELKEKGLDGVEALYQANTPEENVAFVRMADALGYLKTAGSDFHGANKPDIPLGMEVSESYAAPLFERLLH